MWFFAVGAVILWRVWTECYTKEFMTYSGDRSSPDASHAELFGSSELSLEDLERLATTFRPSWELDEAPFAGPATFSAADVRSLQGDPQLREGLHGGANEAFSKGRISEGSSRSRGTVSSRPKTEPVLGVRPIAPTTPLTAEDFEGSLKAPRFKRVLWVGIGAVTVLLVVLGIWATSSSDSKSQAPAEATGAPPPPPPPHPEPTPSPSPSEAQPALLAPPETEPALSAPPRSPPRATALPIAPRPTPAPQVLGRVPPPSPSHAPLPAPKPTARPKAPEPTIVHDVPF